MIFVDFAVFLVKVVVRELKIMNLENDKILKLIKFVVSFFL